MRKLSLSWLRFAERQMFVLWNGPSFVCTDVFVYHIGSVTMAVVNEQKAERKRLKEAAEAQAAALSQSQ
jgi:hypothetical protein